jgi:hypothetical protein
MNGKNWMILIILSILMIILLGCVDTSPEAQKIREEVAAKKQVIESSPNFTALNNCTEQFSKLADKNAPISDLNAKLQECTEISGKIQTDLNDFAKYVNSKKGTVSTQFDKELDKYNSEVVDAFLQVYYPIAQMELIVDPCGGISSYMNPSCLAQKYCDPHWNCTEWGVCDGAKQTRSCTSDSDCKSDKTKPVETRDCTLTCKDSDSGKDIYTKGIVITKDDPNGIFGDDFCIQNPDFFDKPNETGGTDKAVISDATKLVTECSGQNCYLLENYCDTTGSPEFYGVICEKGCKDGACIK